MALRRVVVTGLGVVTPLGSTLPVFWQNLISGRSGIVSLQDQSGSSQSPQEQRGSTSSVSGGSGAGPFDALPSQVAGLVPLGDNHEKGEFNLSNYVTPSEKSKTSLFIQYALAAAHQALEDAAWFPSSDPLKERTGVSIGSSIGSMQEITSASIAMNQYGPRKVSPYFYPKLLVNMASGWVSLKYGFMGPNHTSATACTTGAHSIGEAFRMIQLGDADVIVAGASEAGVYPLGLAGFTRKDPKRFVPNLMTAPQRLQDPLTKIDVDL